MFGHSIGYWIVDFFFGWDPPILVLRVIVGCIMVGEVPGLSGLIDRLRELHAVAARRYWRRKANVRTVGRMQRAYMADQLAIWRRYAGMKDVSVYWRMEQFALQSQRRHAKHERALAHIREAVRDA